MNVELFKKKQEALLQVETVPVGPKQRDFRVQCEIHDNDMSASVRVVAQKNSSSVHEFAILTKLYSEGVRVGIDYGRIEDMVSRRLFNQDVTVAQGVPPEHGQEAKLTPQVDLKEFPSAETLGRATDEKVDKGAPVELDQVLMVKEPATIGRAGFTVKGHRLDPTPGKDVAFACGDKVAVSPDGLKLTAQMPGVAGLVDGKVEVREAEYGEWKYKVRLRKENMEATLIITPGPGPQPGRDEAWYRNLLNSNGVTFGLEPEIAPLIPRKITMTTLINVAAGKEPKPGKNATVIERYKDASGNGRELARVEKGKLLVEKTPMHPGEDGLNVLGEVIAAPQGKDMAIVAGVNTYLSDDGLKLFADIDGYISRINDAYCVIEAKEFDLSGGPLPQKINYDGVIKIHGDVPRGHIIVAGHHVLIQGNVTGSEVVAGGLLQVSGVVSDCEKTKIQAARDMFVDSAIRSRLRAGGNIYFSGKAQNCEILAAGGIYNNDNKSFTLAGGRVATALNVEADEIGSPDSTPTIIEAGVPFAVRTRYEYAVRDMAALKKKQVLIATELKRLFALAKAKKITRPEIEKLRKLKVLYGTVTDKIKQNNAVMNKLLPVIRMSSSSSVITARRSVYPKTVLKIGIHSHPVNEQRGGAFFKINKDYTAIESQEMKNRVKTEMTVMFTDIVAYSTYTSKFGDLAASTMLEKHNNLLFPVVPEHEGAIIKTIGDSIMARFDKPEQALRAAIEMQTRLREHNFTELPEHKIKIRIGMNTGLGIIEDNDVFGDVVNMAARVEGLTGADEIRISEITYSAIPDKHNYEFCSLGMRKLKGKEEMVEIFDVLWED